MSLTKRNSPSGFSTRAIAATVASCTKRRFQCRRFGHGSGWIRSIRAHRLRRRPCQQFGGVAGEQADIADIVGLDLRQDLRHAVDIGLAADEADIRKGLRFRDQMFAAAESDFEPDVLESADRRVGEIGRSRRCRYRAPDAAAGFRSGRPGAARSLWPLRRPKNEPCACAAAAVIGWRVAIVVFGRLRAIIAASGTADAAAAPAARSRRCTSARNGYARPCRRRRGRRALRYAAR